MVQIVNVLAYLSVDKSGKLKLVWRHHNFRYHSIEAAAHEHQRPATTALATLQQFTKNIEERIVMGVS